MEPAATSIAVQPENGHAATVALHYMHCNFVRIHRTMRVTPAMEAGLTSRVWNTEDIIGLWRWPRGSLLHDLCGQLQRARATA